jgi:hypothetical protein
VAEAHDDAADAAEAGEVAVPSPRGESTDAVADVAEASGTAEVPEASDGADVAEASDGGPGKPGKDGGPVELGENGGPVKLGKVDEAPEGETSEAPAGK